MFMFHVNLISTSFVFLPLIDSLTKPQLVIEPKWHVKIAKEKVKGLLLKRGRDKKQSKTITEFKS